MHVGRVVSGHVCKVASLRRTPTAPHHLQGNNGWGAVTDDAPPPKKTKQRPDDDMPASLRKLIALTAVAEGTKPTKRSRNKFANGVPGKEAASKDSGKQPKPSKAAGQEGAKAKGPAPTKAESGGEVRKRKEFKPAITLGEAPRAGRKRYQKERDQRRKAKRRGGAGNEAERLLETRQALSRPEFGEQAAAPLQVQLKRKHWAGDAAAQPAARPTREADPFAALQRIPMAAAGKLMEQQEADRLQYDAIAGYRNLKKARLAQQGVQYDVFNTPESLVRLVNASQK